MTTWAPLPAPQRPTPHPNDNADIAWFKEFLRIPSMHPNPDLTACVAFLKKIGDELGMSLVTHEYHPGLPVAILTRPGTDPTLPSIVLNCHMDVVPVVAERWNALPAGETPFSAWEDPNGYIFARGSQDMKCVGCGYLSALKRLKGVPLRRTIHTVWVPDEEIGGMNGMAKFVHSKEFKNLNAGVALDEGLAHDQDQFVVYYGERTALWMKFKAVGPVGHASKLIQGTAVERLIKVMEAFSAFRDRNSKKLYAPNATLEPGDVTAVNVTHFHTGVTSDGGKTFAYNVIPSDGVVVVDSRVSAEDFDEMLALVDRLCAELNLTVEFTGDSRPKVPSALSSTRSKWCQLITGVLSSRVPQLKLAVFPAATDSRYIRAVGVPAFGFSPMRKTPSLLHDHNECLHRNTFLEGVDVYEALIPVLANAVGDMSTVTGKL